VNNAERQGVRDAFLLGYPVYQMALTRVRAEKFANNEGRTVINRFGHRRHLAGPQDRAVTTQNNDTIASAAWLDLRDGPVVLSVPPLPQRYHSVALLDIFTDNFRILGSRDGGKGGEYLISGPDWDGTAPNNMQHIVAPTNDVWAIVRVLVSGPADLRNAVEAQSKFSVRSLDLGDKPQQLNAVPQPAENPALFLEVVNEMLGRGPLPHYQDAKARSLGQFGIQPGQQGAFASLPAHIQSIWTNRFAEMQETLRAGFMSSATVYDGWSYPDAGIGRFGENDFYRAAISLGGLAALPEEEAIYLSAEKTGSLCYTLAVPREIPLKPGGFWSLTLYEQTPEGRQYLFENPIDRYAIGDRTPGIARNTAGGTDIFICPDSRGAENWLPSPAGKYGLTFRLYLPAQEVRDGRWKLGALISVWAP